MSRKSSAGPCGRFLDDKSPESEVRRLMDTAEGYDPAVWKQMGEQLGLQGLAIPEEFGGSGFAFVELGRGARGDGPSRCCARPYFSTVVLGRRTRCCTSGDDEAKKEYLPGIAIGRDRSPPSPSPRKTAAGTPTGITDGGGQGR